MCMHDSVLQCAAPFRRWFTTETGECNMLKSRLADDLSSSQEEGGMILAWCSEDEAASLSPSADDNILEYYSDKIPLSSEH